MKRPCYPSTKAFVNTYFYNKVRPALFTIILNDLEMFPQLKDDVAYLAVKMTLKEEDEKSIRYRKVLFITCLQRKNTICSD